MTVTEEKTERPFLVYLPVNFGQTYVFLLVILPRPSNRKPSSTFYCIVSKHNLSHHQGFWNNLKFNVWLLFFAFSIFTRNAITTICPPQSPQQCNCQWKSSCRSPQTLCRTSASLLGRASRQKGAWAGARPPGRSRLSLIEKSIIRWIPLPSLFSANRSLMSAFLVRALRTSSPNIVNCNKWLFSSLWNSRFEFQFVQTLEVSFPNIWGLPSKYLRFPFPNILGLRFKYLRFPLQIFGVSLPNIWGLPSNI